MPKETTFYHFEEKEVTHLPSFRSKKVKEERSDFSISFLENPKTHWYRKKSHKHSKASSKNILI